MYTSERYRKHQHSQYNAAIDMEYEMTVAAFQLEFSLRALRSGFRQLNVAL